MTESVAKETLAIEVWKQLEKSGLGGQTLEQLARATKRTKNQVKKGIYEINHALQEVKGQPVMVRTGDWHYVLPQFYTDLMPWTQTRMKDLLTRMMAEKKRFGAADVKWPNNSVRRVLLKTVDRMCEDLEMALEMAIEDKEKILDRT